MAHTIRINKFFTEQGICSRREADRLIESGVITINGRVAKLGDQVEPADIIAREGLVIPWGQTTLYIKYHKPVGVTTTSESHVARNIIAEIGHPERIFPIGRLDKDSSGLILLTNDGDIVNDILRTEFGHEREYLVRVDRPFDRPFLDQMSRGVVILGNQTNPCRMVRVSDDRFRIVLTEGRNRQIRRMGEAVGHRIMRLHRARYAGIGLTRLAPGRWRPLTRAEWTRLGAQVGLDR